MPVARTTFQPTQVVTMGDREYAELLRQGLIYSGSSVLYGSFLGYTDGPPVPMTGVTIGIKTSPGAVTTLATTSTGVVQVGVGSYRYAWSHEGVDPGDYLVTWTGVDPDDVTVTATETVTVEAEEA